MATLDDVQKSPDNGIKVLIVGAGIAGLQAALECWRKGCSVEILERSSELSSIGEQFLDTHRSRMRPIHDMYRRLLHDHTISVDHVA